ncbi:hypothetical protein, partial [Pectobacterium aquaticum]|uniref:hypothetical protein n=1 Tax=Pectobacterium aquaticum TaxID=2204145 RepID=UPI000E3A1C8D
QQSGIPPWIGACHSDLSDFTIDDFHPLDIAFKANAQNHHFSDFSKRLVAMSNIYRSVAMA